MEMQTWILYAIFLFKLKLFFDQIETKDHKTLFDKSGTKDHEYNYGILFEKEINIAVAK